MVSIFNKARKDYGEHREGGPHNYVAQILDNPDDVASANGTTGLMPTPAMNEGEAEAYSDLCAVPQQVSQVVAPLKKPKADQR